eukprot:4551071-Amphidinium_carterae.1
MLGGQTSRTSLHETKSCAGKAAVYFVISPFTLHALERKFLRIYIAMSSQSCSSRSTHRKKCMRVSVDVEVTSAKH